MDSFTQLVLGAACGEAAAGRRLGRRALAWGALAGTIPDLDVLASPFLSEPAALRFHRSVTHSLFFAFVAAPLLGWLVARFYRWRTRPDDPHAEALGQTRPWTVLFFWSLWTHPILDLFTNYGTQLLWPLTDHPFALSSVFIIDPAYTIPLLVAGIVAWRRRSDAAGRRRAVTWGLALSTAYLVWGLGVQQYVRSVARQSLTQLRQPYTRMLVEPAAFSSLLWNVIVEKQHGAEAGEAYGHERFYVGTYSLLDPRPPPGVPRIGLMPIESRWELREPFKGPFSPDRPYPAEPLRTLDWFSRGYLVFRQDTAGVTACDLRFGRTDGFLTRADAPCIFTFRLVRTPEGATFQQKRPSRDDFRALGPLLSRTLGDVPAWARVPPPAPRLTP